MMRELGGGGFTVRPLSQFTAPVPGSAGIPSAPAAAAADDSDADPRGIRRLLSIFSLHTRDSIYLQAK